MATTLLGMLLVIGCRNGSHSTYEEEQLLNSPSNRREAFLLMHSVNSDVQKAGLSSGAAERFRQGMKGRLLAAGMRKAEVGQWIKLGIVRANQEGEEG